MPEKEKAKGKSKDECVRVIVRCRPFNSKEKKEGNGRAVFVNPKDHTVEVKDCDNPKLAPKRWTFDATFDENCTQRDIYDSAAAAIVDDVLEGFNGTIFAYGQTGAGKSFTMEGMKEWRAANKPELRGIIPNAMEHIFERVAADSGDETQFLIRCSYLEIYNEEVRDLLAKGKSKGKLEIKSHPDKGVYVDGLTEVRNRVQHLVPTVVVAVAFPSVCHDGGRASRPGRVGCEASSHRLNVAFSVCACVFSVCADQMCECWRVGRGAGAW